MMHSPHTPPSNWLADARIWRRCCVILLAATVVWLLGSWVATRGWMAPSYEIDVPATLLCALLLLLVGLAAGWRSVQLATELTHASHKQWLSVLLVRRDEAEQAAEAIDSLCDALESLQRACRPLPHQTGAMVNVESERLHRISPDLHPVLAQQAELTRQLQSLQARWVNLQVKFGRGDSLDALAYELQPLSHEHRQLESSLTQLFEQLQGLEHERVTQLDLYRQQAASQDPAAAWQTLLESALTQVDQARTLLARSLDQVAPERSPHIDQYLGLRP